MKRVAEPIETTELCSYGCGNIAKYRNGSGKLMCQYRHNKCPSNRKKNSSGLKRAYEEEKRPPGWSHLTYEQRTNRKDKRFADFSYEGKGQHKNALLLERGHKCECCGLSEWLDKPITLELEHSDGDRKNNTRENLKLLCPNCHSQTPTWRRSGQLRKFNIKKYTDEEMIEAIKSSSNINQVLTKLDLRYGSVSTLISVMVKYKVNFNNADVAG